MSSTNELDRAVTQQLADHDLRYTTGRRAVVAGLRRAGGPVTLPELLEMSDDLAQSSAYRNLSLLEEAGVVRRLSHGGDHSLYELSEALTEHHHHLICESCGSVADVVFDDAVEQALAVALAALQRSDGFVAAHHNLDVYGHCANCA
ncbi:MAG: Fur family transcriptional regulator [Ilumatobacter sp.]|uniref:Fur family transcriptional regulator n=1 Tax=Ilumatobacter sp. TaxID=1967498 RepID=UPI003918DD75